MTNRETSTEKQFLDKVHAERSLNRKTARSVLMEYNEFILETLFSGKNVYFPFGTLSLTENKYQSKAIMKSRGRGHQHKYRPRLKFNQAFCQCVDKREDEITQAINNSETTE